MSEATRTHEQLLDEIKRLQSRIDQLEAAGTSCASQSPPPARETSRSDRLLKLHIEHSPLGMIEWDRDYRVRLWSRRAEEVFGWSADEMIGERWDEIPFVHVDDRERVESTCFGLLSSEVDFCTCSNRNYRKDGAVVHCEWFNSVICDDHGELVSLLSLAHDVTARVHAEEALKLSEERLRMVFDQQFQFTAILSADGIVLEINDLPLRTQGARRDEFVGKPFWLAPAWRGFPEWQKIIKSRVTEAASRAEPVLGHDAYLTADGSTGYADASYTAIRDKDSALRYILVQATDVTEQKTAAAALRKMESEIAHVARVSTMGEMVGGIAHELNQPLYAIQNFSKASVTVLEGGVQLDRDQLTEWLHQITDAAEHAGKVLARLRDFVSQRPTEKSAINISDVVDAAIAMTQHEAQQHRISVGHHLPPNLPSLFADSIQIQQVVVILVRNGIEAIPDANDVRQIEISVKNTDNSLQVSVSDTGKGFADDGHEALFKAFSSTKPNGMGLGLAIAKTIIESHGGNLWASNRAGGGAEVHFTLDAMG